MALVSVAIWASSIARLHKPVASEKTEATTQANIKAHLSASNPDRSTCDPDGRVSAPGSQVFSWVMRRDRLSSLPVSWPKPEEIAAVIDFLANPASHVITGAAIPVHGSN